MLTVAVSCVSPEPNHKRPRGPAGGGGVSNRYDQACLYLRDGGCKAIGGKGLPASILVDSKVGVKGVRRCVGRPQNYYEYSVKYGSTRVCVCVCIY